MAGLFGTLKEFKDFKNGPIKSGILHGSLGGIKKKVIIPVPADTNPTRRWWALKFLLQLVWSFRSAGAVATGALLSLLSFFAEQPTQMLRNLLDDPDLEAHIVELTMAGDLDPKFTTRGLDMTEQEKKFREMANAGPGGGAVPNAFVHAQADVTDIRSTEELQKAISTVTLQIWILLTKAVTAPDTAKESETKRWIKLLQQKRVDEFYRLKNQWLDAIRDKISNDISVRRFMVQILIAINRASGTRGRLLEAIADIGHYISETGMASFFLTIKYGIETKYAALALNEFQGDLSTIISLMKLYKEQGDKAPYLVILEESIQTKFAPGNYALLWSYAMGVGTALDRSMANLNFNRPFLEPNYFRLGQEVVNRLEGNVDTRMAEELGLTQGQVDELRVIVKEESGQQPQQKVRPRVSALRNTDYIPDDDEADGGGNYDEDQEEDEDEIQPSTTATASKPSLIDFQSRLKKVAANLKTGRKIVDVDVHNHGNQASGDLEVMNAV
ncbi:nucleocapsid protein [Shaan virus]|uniref:Nucleocapsid n=1 Tax=Shaan virus TaxID=2848072 RepID=A0A346NTM0_9MONO|nr:nucleocapsid protein [Bat paramyxovirus]AXR70613.1 nucleocapsid protein [Shaan virus]WPV62559.1 MAG: nucleocapsid protein [Jeilongvirus miniopteri]